MEKNVVLVRNIGVYSRQSKAPTNNDNTMEVEVSAVDALVAQFTTSHHRGETDMSYCIATALNVLNSNQRVHFLSVGAHHESQSADNSLFSLASGISYGLHLP